MLVDICTEMILKTINKDSIVSGDPEETANQFIQFLVNEIPNLLLFIVSF